MEPRVIAGGISTLVGTNDGSLVGLFCMEYQGSHSDRKTWENGKAFSSQGKIMEFWTDGKSQGKSHKIPGSLGEVRQMFFVIFLLIFKWTVYYLLKWIKFAVKKQNIKKNTEKVREFCQSRKVGTMNLNIVHNICGTLLIFTWIFFQLFNMRLPNTFGRAERITAEYTYGTRATAGYSFTFLKPLLGNPNIRSVLMYICESECCGWTFYNSNWINFQWIIY